MRLYLIVGTVLAIAGAVSWKIYQAGRAAEQAEILKSIERQNNDAGSSAEDWRARLRDCNERGGLFDFESGACQQ